ncbi:Translocon-associated protein subunit beta [Plasmodiophora brassicae]
MLGVAVLVLWAMAAADGEQAGELVAGVGRRMEVVPGREIRVTVRGLRPRTTYEARVSHPATYPVVFDVRVSMRRAKRRLLDVDKSVFTTGDGVADAEVSLTARYHGVPVNPSHRERPVPFDIIVMPMYFHVIPADVVGVIAFIVITLGLALVVVVPFIHRRFFSNGRVKVP